MIPRISTHDQLSELARREDSDAAAVAAESVDQLRRRTSVSRDWEWHDEASPQNWELADLEWQAFNEHWRNYQGRLDQAGTTLPLRIPRSHHQPSFQTKEGSIYIRESYVYSRDCIWETAAFMSTSQTSGALIRGQPGVGKTVFLWYLHVSLLKDGQVVLLHMPSNPPLLFLHDKVYTRTSTSPFAEEEQHPFPTSKHGFIWSLFDVNSSTQDITCPPPLALHALCFPVQASFSEANISLEWVEKRSPYTGGLPLWTRQQLLDAFPLHEQFDRYREDLQSVLDAWPQPQLPERPGVMQALRSAYGEKHPESAEAMIETMLDIAIDAVGRVPVDVYAAMLNYATEKTRIEAALEVSYHDLDLKRVLEAFQAHWRISVPAVTHLIVCFDIEHIRPDGSIYWTLAFKSRWIAKTMAGRLADEWLEDEARETLSLFKSVPQARPIWGRLCEPFAHRALADTVGNRPWVLRAMVRDDGADGLTYRACSTPASLTFPKIKRRREQYHGIPDAPVHRSYYTPVDPSFPLIDGFTVDINEESRSATLWLLQIAATDAYGDSRRPRAGGPSGSWSRSCVDSWRWSRCQYRRGQNRRHPLSTSTMCSSLPPTTTRTRTRTRCPRDGTRTSTRSIIQATSICYRFQSRYVKEGEAPPFRACAL
ncbi:hypothetical protein C8T65DRAFT_90232 [Cerioporus squamosus]|nr:hypothetical protein C8T65DRAFT_90232 [Cerioporus squamosus]